MSAPPLRDPVAVDASRSRRRWRRGRPAGQLERLRAEPVERIGDAVLLDPPEHLPGVVARRVGLRRRSAELDRRVEHALRRGCRCVTVEPGRASAHIALRANFRVGPGAARTQACGCSMLADANTSAVSPAAMRSRSSPEAPNVKRTACRDAPLELAPRLARARAGCRQQKPVNVAVCACDRLRTERTRHQAEATAMARSASGVRVREEQLLAADLVGRDGRLPGRRDHPVDEFLRRAAPSTCGYFAGLTTITPYWLNRRLSPSTSTARSPGS